jgi:hypothetical protein
LKIIRKTFIYKILKIQTEKEAKMACEDITLRLKELRNQKAELKKQMELVLAPKVLAPMEHQLADLEYHIAVEEKNLADCKAIAEQLTNPAPRAFIGRVKRILCSEANKKEWGKQEPYLIMTSVDIPPALSVGPIVLPLPKPRVHCVLIGPFSDVEPTNSYYTSDLPAIKNPNFWNLSGLPERVDSPNRVIFIGGLFENDSSSPEAIRMALETALAVSVVTNRGLAHTAFANTLINDIIGTFDTSRLVGVSAAFYPDDRIGVHHLAMTTDDLNTINALGRLEKSLTFTRTLDDKVIDNYTVTFSFEG